MTNDQTNSTAPTLDGLLHRADEFARHEPTRATASAFGVGFILNLLPIGAIVGLLVSIAFSLVRPALLLLGLMKAGELLRSKTHLEAHHE